MTGGGGTIWRSNALAWTTDVDPADCITFDGWITDEVGWAKEMLAVEEARQRRDDGHPDVRLRGQRGHVPPLHVGPPLGAAR